MRSLFRFLLRNYFWMMFLALEGISFVLLISFNNFQRVKFVNSSNQFAGAVYERFNSFDNYFTLNQTNNKLASENAKLRTKLQLLLLKNTDNLPNVSDTIVKPIYVFTAGKVISNSVNRHYNYITINKGSRHGIKQDMGIINEDGVVGVITNVSPNFAVGLSLLNKRLSIPAKISRLNYFGALVWDGESYNSADLKEIPFHIMINVGDTIVTSGYSNIFPEGIMIGTVKNYNVESGTNFFNIKVDLAVNFKTLRYVDIIQNNMRDELIKLESNNNYD